MRVGAEIFPWNRGDFRFFKQIICDIAWRSQAFTVHILADESSDIRKNIKGALWLEALYTADGIEALDDNISPFRKFDDHHRHIFLRALNRLESSGLSYGGRV